MDIHAKAGTDVSNDVYAGLPGDNPHWIAIQNIGSIDDAGAAEEVELQASSLDGDDLSKTGSVVLSAVQDIVMSYGDIIYGKFSMVRLRITGGSGHYNRVRLIRGV